MNQLITLILFIIFMFFQVKAQPSPHSHGNLGSSDETNFQPSLAVVISALTIIFSLSTIILIYAKYCHRANNNHLVNNNEENTVIQSGSRISGLDKTVIESLPFFRFSLLKGSREGLECAVCLSRFEDIEILRLLPKCRHAFHIDCVDQWLEKHSSCPLCRQRVSIDDVSLLTCSNSFRFLWNPSDLREDSSINIFVEREESNKWSSRFSIGSSFRKFGKGKKEDEIPIQENSRDFDEENGNKLHKFNHKIVVSDFAFRNRWSNVSSSDLMFLNSAMISSISSDRLTSSDPDKKKEAEIISFEAEMESKREDECKASSMEGFASKTKQIYRSGIVNTSEMRSMSEITVHSRSRFCSINDNIRESHLPKDVTKEEKIKRLWYSIARKTAQWFVNREKGSQPSISQSLDV